MIDEKGMRRSEFVEGVKVQLSDGQFWTLASDVDGCEDTRTAGLLELIYQAEDPAEGLRSELALTILLLSRNYHLDSDQLYGLLDFGVDQASRNAHQKHVHQFVVEPLARSRKYQSQVAQPTKLPFASSRPSWAARLLSAASLRIS